MYLHDSLLTSQVANMLNTNRLISVFIPNCLAFFANLLLTDDAVVVDSSNVDDVFLTEYEAQR